jgi:hypothetical protein
MANKKKSEKKAPTRTSVKVSVFDLHVGDELVTKIRRRGERKYDWQDQDPLEMLQRSDEIIVERTVTVRNFALCPSQWRTHVHINDTDCYDSRQQVWIAVPVESEVSKAEEASGKYVDPREVVSSH